MDHQRRADHLDGSGLDRPRHGSSRVPGLLTVVAGGVPAGPAAVTWYLNVYPTEKTRFGRIGESARRRVEIADRAVAGWLSSV